jgi:hypothetical protein
MFDEGHSGALVAIASTDSEWQPIYQASSQVVLYNPTSHALSIRSSMHEHLPSSSLCPYCNRPLPSESEGSNAQDRVANYFQLLEVSNEMYSRPSTPKPMPETSAQGGSSKGAFTMGSMAEGYFKTFFQEECRLGMGANGSVFLCQVSLSGYCVIRSLAFAHIACVGRESSWLATVSRC